MRYLKLFENFEDIESICEKYGIRNYIINEDGSIDVDGSVSLSYMDLTKLPLKFRNVSGSFDCGNNQLTSLEGSPKTVGGGFHCGDNQLTSLEGGPESVGIGFYCGNNQLTSLEGSPKTVGSSFNCCNNQLTSLEGCPQSVGGDFDCYDNPISNIWDLFMDKEKIDLFNDYDILRGDSVIIDRLNEFLIEIGKEPVKSVKGWNNI